MQSVTGRYAFKLDERSHPLEAMPGAEFQLEN